VICLVTMSGLRQRPGEDAQSGMTLIELLVGMTIMGVLSTMVLLTWFTLQSSYASSEQNAKQRDVARQAVWRMATEIRDAQGTDGYAPVITGGRNTIVVGTSFNNAGNADSQPSDPTDPDTTVHRVRFQYSSSSSTIFRTEDTNGDLSFTGETPVPIVKNVVNSRIPSPSGTYTPLFRYTYYDTSGSLQTVDSMTAAGIDTARILNVQIRALVDIKPNKSPTYMDLKTTVQPRNAAR
jgi:prepilin-type N-terminal cleavage/methylation domain-containing protein